LRNNLQEPLKRHIHPVAGKVIVFFNALKTLNALEIAAT
jgi:hypothetical protein